ncbi:MAG: methionyl-tRNA formyltransferase [Spirochaetales bacterium]|nr:methionyl-tRNA formyltransferase [Spirochaetales bacterium]
MRIVFAGSPGFAVPSLAALHENFPIQAVLTNPDRPAGRGKQPEPTAVKNAASALDLPVLQPGVFDPPFLEKVRSLGAGLLVVVAFGRIFRKEFLDLFPLGGVNLHASLLPRYRGPSPITAAILNGDRETGVTVQKLALKMDAGDILGVRSLPLSGRETAGSLSRTLAGMGAELLVSALRGLEQGRIEGIRQEESRATYCSLVNKDDGRIDWSADAGLIERMIRAYDPWPRAFTTWGGRRLNILAGGVYPEAGEATGTAGGKPGLVLAVDNRYGILVNAGRGVLFVSSLQLQSKKPLDWRSFLNGQKDFIGALLGE